jgi:hypothetical protein
MRSMADAAMRVAMPVELRSCRWAGREAVMRLIVTAVLAVAGALTTLFVAPDAASFGIIQGAMGLLLVVALVLLLVFLLRRS